MLLTGPESRHLQVFKPSHTPAADTSRGKRGASCRASALRCLIQCVLEGYPYSSWFWGLAGCGGPWQSRRKVRYARAMSRRVSITVICAAIVHLIAGACNTAAPPEPRAAWQARVEGVFHTHCVNTADPTVHCANGCTYTWSVTQMEAPEGIVVSCPSKSGTPWGPDCKTDLPPGLNDPDGNGTCWEPPAHWCFGLSLLTETVACDPTSDRCCAFESDCIPCNWEVCAYGPMGASSPRCQAAVGKNTCPPGLVAMVAQCVVCSGLTVCPLATTSP